MKKNIKKSEQEKGIEKAKQIALETNKFNNQNKVEGFWEHVTKSKAQ